MKDALQAGQKTEGCGVCRAKQKLDSLVAFYDLECQEEILKKN